MTRPARAEWTTFADLVQVLERRHRTGTFLRAEAAGTPWEPISVPVKRPRATDVLHRLDEVRAWVDRLERECSGRASAPKVRLEYRPVIGRAVGRNELPTHAWLDTPEQLYGLLHAESDVQRLRVVLRRVDEGLPALRPWVERHPRETVEHADRWQKLQDAVAWIATAPRPDLYLRQVDVAGVDTKFIETHRLLLASMLEEMLPADRIDQRFGRGDFAGRFGFRRRPFYTRIRFLGENRILPTAITEVTLRSEELAQLDPGLGCVIIVENEISYLALPPRPDTLAIFGSGFALGSVHGLTWLEGKRIVYWGDVDTYGFVILNRLRARYADVESILMDHETLLAHRGQWVREDVPSSLPLTHLTGPESELYRDLIEDRYGEHVRLEQERIRFSAVTRALPALD